MPPMDADTYQREAMKTLSPAADLLHAALGLAGEAGEVADALKKARYQGHPLDNDHLVEELGDLLWHAAETAHFLGVPLSQVMERNIAKLRRRYGEAFDVQKGLDRNA